MDKYTATIAQNILKKMDEVQGVLDYIYTMEHSVLEVKTDDCPYCVRVPTIPLRAKIYTIIKEAYEEELKDLESQLAKL